MCAKQDRDTLCSNRLPAMEKEASMTEAHSSKYRRKLRMVDNAIFNAITTLFPYYGLLRRADPILGAVCEQLILRWEQDRERIYFIYLAAWETDHEQFSTIGAAAEIIAEERTFGKKGQRLCREYSQHWDRLVVESSRLLEQRAKALRKQLDSLPSKPENLTP